MSSEPRPWYPEASQALGLPLERPASLETGTGLLLALLDRVLSPKRRQHSMACADLAGRMATFYGLDPLAARFAGLAHDLCKELPTAVQLDLAERCPVPVRGQWRLNHRLPHGLAAASFVSEQGLSADPAILQALAWHTLGDAAMPELALLVYIADKLEPSRGAWAEPLRRAWLGGAYPGLPGLLRLALEVVGLLFEYFTEHDYGIAPSTLALYTSLKERCTEAGVDATRPEGSDHL